MGDLPGKRVTVYWRPGCTFCAGLFHSLASAGITHERLNIWEDPEAAAFVRSVAGGNETVPTVTVGDEALVNPTVQQVAAALNRPALVLAAMDNGPPPEAVVTLEEITADNLRAVMRLRVKPDQEGFVAPNSVSIAEYCYAHDAWMRAICAGGEPVGFVLLSEERSAPRYYLWRYMIDGSHQGKGFGARAMQLVIDHVRTLPKATELYVSYVSAPGGPRDFYAGLGFVDTGVEHEGELEMKLTLD